MKKYEWTKKRERERKGGKDVCLMMIVGIEQKKKQLYKNE